MTFIKINNWEYLKFHYNNLLLESGLIKYGDVNDS